MGIIEEYAPVSGCTKHGPCEGCRLDELEDLIKQDKVYLTELLEEFHDAQRAARGDSGNSGSGDSS